MGYTLYMGLVPGAHVHDLSGDAGGCGGGDGGDVQLRYLLQTIERGLV
jgi:hypothetical protein